MSNGLMPKTKPLELLCKESIAQGMQALATRLEQEEGMVIIQFSTLSGRRLRFRVEGDKLTPIPFTTNEG